MAKETAPKILTFTRISTYPVILNRVKDLSGVAEILRYAQNDNAVVIRDSCILSLVSCLLFPVSI